MQLQYFYLRVTRQDGSVILSPAFLDEETPDRLAKVCQRDPNVVEAVVVLRAAEAEPNRAA